MTELDKAIYDLLERDIIQRIQAARRMKLKGEDGLKDLPTLEAKVDIIDNQLSLIVADVTVPIRVAHVFDHIYACRVEASTLPKANLDINSILDQIAKIFHANKPEVLEINRSFISNEIINFDIENTDGRCNRKFSKEIRAYMMLRRRIEFINALRTIISKAVTVKREPDAFLFTMKNNDEITLFTPKEFQSTDSILSHIDKDDANLAGFEIEINCYNQYGKLITYRRFNTWRSEQW